MSENKFTKKMEVGITVDNSPFCIDGFCNVDGERFEVCAVWGVNNDTGACAQSKANAHLMAAAPEMYEEIESEIEFLKGLMEISRTGSTKNVTDVLSEKIKSKQALLLKARVGHD